MKHNKVIQQEFSKQAARFGQKGLTLSSQDILDWIVSLLPLQKGLRVLDVAAGTGILSRAIAPYMKDVFAIDLTPRMLSYARQETAKSKLENIWFEEGNVERLPFPADCFDLVVARLAIHHFEKPIFPLHEMVRVCKRNGQIGIIDLLSPEDPSVAEVYNKLERLRDPSHVVALSRNQMEQLFIEAGIALEHVETRDVEVDFQKWVQMTETKPEIVQVIEEKLLSDIDNGTKTGTRPFIRNGNLKFLQVWSVIIGTKLRD